MNYLGVVDFLAILSMLALSWTVGIYYGCRSSNTKGDNNNVARYVMGNYKMGVVPVAFSLAVTTVSGSLMVGVVGEVYLHGVQYIFFAIGGCLGLIISGILVVPIYRRMKYISIYEYLERRYDRNMRLLFSSVYIFAKIVFSAVALYVPAICISTLTDVPQWISISVAGLICVCYCVSGGIRAVIWTDVIQAAFMMLCNILIIVLGSLKVGGFGKVWETSVQGQRIFHLTLVEDAHTRYSIWSLTLGALIVYMNAMSGGQAAGQRILSVRGLREAQCATFLGGIFIFALVAIIIWTGIVVYANVSDCDPFLHPHITGVKSQDQILIYGMAQILEQPGLKGLALAGIFSGSLSTFSSYINSFSTLTMEDFVKPALKKKGKILSDDRSLLLCKALTCVYGFVCIIVAFMVPFLGGVIKAGIQITGATGGPLLAVIFLGIFSRMANKKGVLLGLIIGLSFNLWLSVGSTLQPKLIRTLPLTNDNCPTERFLQNFTINETTYQQNATELSLPFVMNSNYTNVAGTDLPENDIFPLFTVSFMWQGPIGFVITMMIGIIASYFFRSKTATIEIDPRLLSDWLNSNKDKIAISDLDQNSTLTPLCDVDSSNNREIVKLKLRIDNE